MNPRQFASDKILNHPDRIQAWLNGENPFAVTMEIDPTNVCNHRCPGCSGWPIADKSSLSKETMKAVIAEAKALGLRGLTFTGGGEPLCHPGTEWAVRFAAECGLDVALITNGSLLHKADMEGLIESCRWIRISLDAGTPGMHERVHGTSDFATIIRNIEKLVGVKHKTRSDCTIGVGYLTGAGTDDPEDMADFVSMAVSLGVDYAQFRPFHTQAKKDLHRFKPIDWGMLEDMATTETEVLCSKHKYDAMVSGEVKRTYRECYGHQFATTLCANGDMTICCHTRGLGWATLGNVNQQSVGQIWNSKERMCAAGAIDLGKCPLLCRCNTFNEILWRIKERKEHVNFL